MARADDYRYLGGELDLFALATNWKRYLKAEIASYLAGDVLEVGAGIGATTAAFYDGRAQRWICLEPDAEQAQQLRASVRGSWPGAEPRVIVGSLRTLADQPAFDCILYVDVLEHIADDRSEIQEAARRVRRGGHILVMAPAHQWLFSEFDKKIGHLRRYNKKQLRALMPPGWSEIKVAYLDSVGVLLSLGNVLTLKRALPTRKQILIWDRLCVPLSRVVDKVLLGCLGKSVLAVWSKA